MTSSETSYLQTIIEIDERRYRILLRDYSKFINALIELVF
jgi:hypothetical protein